MKLDIFAVAALTGVVIVSAAASETQSPKIPARDPKAQAELIDLSAHYNAALTESWHPASNLAGESGNDLSELPRGIHKLDGIEFDLRGLIQVSGNGSGNSRGPYP